MNGKSLLEWLGAVPLRRLIVFDILALITLWNLVAMFGADRLATWVENVFAWVPG